MRCQAGHEWEALAFNIISGHWCKQCHFESRKIDLKMARALARANNGRLLSNDIEGSLVQLRWECEHGHRFERAYKQFSYVKKFCPRCKKKPPVAWPTGTKERSAPDRITAMRAKCRATAAEHGGDCADHEYKNTHTAITWTCAVGHDWQAAPGNVVYAGSWCPTCAGLARTGAKLVTVVSSALPASAGD
jgi:hypothetical protein